MMSKSYTSASRSNNMRKSEPLCLQSSELIPFESVVKQSAEAFPYNAAWIFLDFEDKIYGFITWWLIK